MAALHRTSRIVSSGLALERTLRELISQCVESIACDACLLCLPDTQSGEIVLRTWQSAHAGEIGTVRLRPDGGVAEWLLQHAAAVVLSSGAASDPRFRPLTTVIADGFEALASVPLIGRGEVVGVLGFYHREPREYTADELALLCFVGEQMGGAIACASLAEDNARLRNEALLARQQLEERKIIERAKGLLQQRFGLSEDRAYQRLRDESRRRRLPMREVAEAVLLVEGIATRPDHGASGK